MQSGEILHISKYRPYVSDLLVVEPPSPKRISTLQHIGALLKYCQHQWVWFSLGFVFLVIYAVARIFIPFYTGAVISGIVKKAGLQVLAHSVLIMAILTMATTFFGGLRGGCFDYATALVSRQVRLDLFRSLVHQEIGFFDITKSGIVGFFFLFFPFPKSSWNFAAE
ncbi:hypothetical protein OESDEN_23051 [Oesophagostomum dentatum]|uniref:ABC transmembrane type-1 domain-containing protein n=1 Tax=Oesophagostomum dentatum TaxID=61180 RepID=A0A0B1RXA9_OESDE|nr:hypothetical protein OESDEN_23051 [Oesophagostomum dentatum]